MVKNSQFAPNADGVGWCPNKNNSKEGNTGIHITDQPGRDGQNHGKHHAAHSKAGTEDSHWGGTTLFATVAPEKTVPSVLYGCWSANQFAWGAGGHLGVSAIGGTPGGLDRVHVGQFGATLSEKNDGIPRKHSGGDNVDGRHAGWMGQAQHDIIRTYANPGAEIYVTLGGASVKYFSGGANKAARMAILETNLKNFYMNGNQDAVDATTTVKPNPRGVFKYDGLDFDMEGDNFIQNALGTPTQMGFKDCREVFEAVKTAIDPLRPGKPLKLCFTVFGHRGTASTSPPSFQCDPTWFANPKSEYDYIALMLYGGDAMGDKEGGWDATISPCVDGGQCITGGNLPLLLNEWLSDRYITKSKLILGFTVIKFDTLTATTQSNADVWLQAFNSLVKDNGLAGINFWQDATTTTTPSTSDLASFVTKFVDEGWQALCPSSVTKCPIIWDPSALWPRPYDPTATIPPANITCLNNCYGTKICS